ncbi:MAG: YegS/Rv2252/BmrU family lipid kinase [Kineosporiaceae bacterium]|nr:YegS/Rv2252/BmrU family lipid kinase [Kineosporiaceae bacterium]MBK8074148.1 YegS/Rv2252/BmrU family lipid kinase [Kineosporiaceae bacterium]
MTHPLQERLHRNRRLTLLINVRSRRGAAQHRAARRALEAGGWSIDAEHLISDPAGQLPALLPRLAAEQPDLLVVGSGDGTVSHVVHHLAHSPTVLGYLPLGTTNNFGRSLGLPLKLSGAVDVINQGRVADIDLGRVDDRYFANLVSIGISGEVAGRTPHQLKRRIGRPAYALTGARTLVRHQPFTAEVRSGTTTWRVRTHQLNVANGSMHAGTAISADASLDDGLLMAYTLGGRSRFSTVRATVRQVLTPRHPSEHKGFLLGGDFTVSTDRPLPVDVDGEIVGTTPIEIQVVPQALHVMVPWPPGAPGPNGATPG